MRFHNVFFSFFFFSFFFSSFSSASHLSSHFDYNLNGLCFFNVSGKLETSIIKEASLWIYLRPHSKIRQSRVEVRIWNAMDMEGHSEPLKILKVEIGRFGEWTHFKATSIIKQWVKNTKLNYGLNITAFDSYGNSRIWTPNIPNHGEEYVSKYYINNFFSFFLCLLFWFKSIKSLLVFMYYINISWSQLLVPKKFPYIL